MEIDRDGLRGSFGELGERGLRKHRVGDDLGAALAQGEDGAAPGYILNRADLAVHGDDVAHLDDLAHHEREAPHQVGDGVLHADGDDDGGYAQSGHEGGGRDIEDRLEHEEHGEEPDEGLHDIHEDGGLRDAADIEHAPERPTCNMLHDEGHEHHNGEHHGFAYEFLVHLLTPVS